jgi:hypothetical protein
MDKIKLLLTLAAVLTGFVGLYGQVNGTVRDENGDLLPSATVYIENTSIGVVANELGQYTITPHHSGKHVIIAQYVGYKSIHQMVDYTIGKSQQLDFNLQPETSVLGEVTIFADGEDPAYPVIREAIKKRDFHRHQVKQVSADLYVKGKIRMLDAPKALMGQDIGNLGGILDTARQGILYLSESLSKYYYQDPDRAKEVMISSIKSGEKDVFTANRFDIFKFDVYEEYYQFARTIPSPISDRALSHYKYMLESSTYNDDGEKIYKIRVIPTSTSEPLLDGHIYIADVSFNVTSFDCRVSGGALRGTIFDSLAIKQVYVPVDGPELRRLLSQVVEFRGGAFGFKIGGTFSYVFSNYNLKPDLTGIFEKREAFSVDNKALNTNLDFWQGVRPVPLTPDESKDYVFKDSLAKIWKSKPFLDSVDRANNVFKPLKLLTGYSYQNSFKDYAISLPSVTTALAFNPVEGWNYSLPIKYTKNDSLLRKWNLTPLVSYGISDKEWKPSFSIARTYDNYTGAEWYASIGRFYKQFDNRDPISKVTNTANNLLLKINRIRLYDLRMISAGWKKEIANGIYLDANFGYEHRKPLQNNTEYSIFYEEKIYDSNRPKDIDTMAYNENRYLNSDVTLTFRPFQSYSSYPNLKVVQESPWPIIDVAFNFGYALTDGFNTFLFTKLGIRDSYLPTGLWGYTSYRLGAGTNLLKKQTYFADYYHPGANGLRLPWASNRLGFNLMNFYSYSTNQSFLEIFWKHHFDGRIFDHLPLIKKTSLKEVIGVNTFYDAIAGSYVELTVGIENFKIGPIKIFDLEYSWAFANGKFTDQGIVIRLNKLF